MPPPFCVSGWREMDNPHYDKEIKPAVLQGKPITVTHITPILTQEQRDKRKCEVENQLYEVFSKYKKGRAKAE